MSGHSGVRPTPWNSRAIGVDCFEIEGVDDRELTEIVPRLAPGNYMIRIDPLASKEVLHRLGFYYCDTSIEGLCTPERLVRHPLNDVTLVESVPVEELLAISGGAFANSHYHRDFRVDRERADERFDLWVRDIHAAGEYFAFEREGAIVGFFAFRGEAIILQAMAENARGRGLGKSCWTLACHRLFANGCRSLVSPMSTSNLPIINLHIAMGFRFHKVEDIYHLVVPSA